MLPREDFRTPWKHVLSAVVCWSLALTALYMALGGGYRHIPRKNLRHGSHLRGNTNYSVLDKFRGWRIGRFQIDALPGAAIRLGGANTLIGFEFVLGAFFTLFDSLDQISCTSLAYR